MAAARTLADARTVGQLRAALRDAARLELAASRATAERAEQAVETGAEQLAGAMADWGEALGRTRPDPFIVRLAGAQVVRAEVRHKAALLDQKIARNACDDAALGLAGAEARLEGARMIARTASRAHDRDREERAARETEDTFIWRAGA